MFLKNHKNLINYGMLVKLELLILYSFWDLSRTALQRAPLK